MYIYIYIYFFFEMSQQGGEEYKLRGYFKKAKLTDNSK